MGNPRVSRVCYTLSKRRSVVDDQGKDALHIRHQVYQELITQIIDEFRSGNIAHYCNL